MRDASPPSEVRPKTRPARARWALLSCLGLSLGCSDQSGCSASFSFEAGSEPSTVEPEPGEPRRVPVVHRGDPKLPGIKAPNEQVDAELRRAMKAWTDTKPHSPHTRADGGPRYVNRLATEQSPYLRQHANNPV